MSIEKIQSFLPIPLPEVSSSVTVECPDPQKWKMYDGNATEVETLEFIYALVRLLKPSVCIETGTWLGYGTLYIAQALQDNGLGKVSTAEVDTGVCTQASALF